MSELRRNRSNQWFQVNHDARNLESLPLHYRFRISMTRSVGIALMVFVCTWSSSINAQQTEKSEKAVTECDIVIAPIDRQQLAAEPEKTKARIIALMLQDMDRCIGVQTSRVAGAQQGSTLAAVPGSGSAQNGSQTMSAGQTDPSEQAQIQTSQASRESSTSEEDSTRTPSVEPDDSTIADILRDATNSSTSIQHNTSVFDFGSDDEIVLDDYAKTLHEAYLAETDPVLKEALGKELTNYLNNKKR